MQQQSGWEKFKTKFAEAPLVPLGSLVTAAILVGGFWSFSKGKDKAMQQRFMRARVGAQGFTLGCLFYFSFYNPPQPVLSLEEKIIQHQLFKASNNNNNNATTQGERKE